MTTLSSLSPLEARVLGVLIEKQRTAPDTYPLSLNALTAGCNQKTSRDPVMDASEAEVAEALANLRSQSLIMESSGGRVSRYAHNAERVLGLPSQSVALLTVLMLRGPQTAGELRINCERLHKFADISTVEAFLAELSERADGALVQELPRQPGARENRWAHLLCGEVEVESYAAASPAPRNEALEARVAQLEVEVAELRAALAQLQSGQA
ncbi:YceH family protein [Chitinimonas sp.]|uniref:YceH family protein n=1 Tax=Chitinimonas sp. TaxID=1934313 RepID=UPI002F94E2B9